MYATQTSRAFSDMPARCLSIVFRIWFPLKVEKTAFSFGISNIQKKSISTAPWNMMQANKTLTWYFIRSTQTKNNTKCASKRHSHKTWTLSCSHMWKIMMTKWNMKMVCGWSFFARTKENEGNGEIWGISIGSFLTLSSQFYAVSLFFLPPVNLWMANVQVQIEQNWCTHKREWEYKSWKHFVLGKFLAEKSFLIEQNKNSALLNWIFTYSCNGFSDAKRPLQIWWQQKRDGFSGEHWRETNKKITTKFE